MVVARFGVQKQAGGVAGLRIGLSRASVQGVQKIVTFRGRVVKYMVVQRMVVLVFDYADGDKPWVRHARSYS